MPQFRKSHYCLQFCLAHAFLNVNSTPEQEYEVLAKQENLSASDALAAFDKLGPAKAEQFIGSWKGGTIKTNHVLESRLMGMRWAGKDFRSTEDVDPIMVYKEDGERSWANQWGHARVSIFCQSLL